MLDAVEDRVGRAKGYDRQEVAREAMRLFWERGYHATSTQALAERMGINSYSLFAEFGSKQGLYEASIALYMEEVVAGHFDKLHDADAGLLALMDTLEYFAFAAGGPGAYRGCFLANVAAERGAEDAPTKVVVEAYVKRIRDGVANALHNAHERGELRDGVCVEDQSSLLTSAFVGFFVMMRANVDREVLIGACRAARSQLACIGA